MQLTNMGNQPQEAERVKPRGRPSDEGRFIWQSSLAIERIVNELGQTQAAYGIAVYVALTRLSSKESGNPRIEATVAKIAGMARLSYRKVFDVLKALETMAKVIAIEPAERAKGTPAQPASTYVLLACRLHKGKSGRLHDTQPADCTGVAPSHADNPIDSAFGRESSDVNTQRPQAGPGTCVSVKEEKEASPFGGTY